MGFILSVVFLYCFILTLIYTLSGVFGIIMTHNTNRVKKKTTAWTILTMNIIKLGMKSKP